MWVFPLPVFLLIFMTNTLLAESSFSPEEEDDTAKLQDLSSPLPSPVSKEEILQMAVESIIYTLLPLW